jgi:hypothetical protein
MKYKIAKVLSFMIYTCPWSLWLKCIVLMMETSLKLEYELAHEEQVQ